MRIVVLSEKFWPEGSGGELATYLYVKGIVENTDYDVIVLTGTPKEKISHDLLKHRRLQFVNLEFLRAPHRIILWKNLQRGFKILLRYIEDKDILYIPGSSIIVAPKMKKQKKIKIIYHLHGYMPISYNSAVYYPYEKRKKRIYFDTCYYASKSGVKHLFACILLHHYLTYKARNSLRYVDRIICVSKRQQYIINDAIPWTRGKTVVLYNPPPPDAINVVKKPYPAPLLLFTGGDNPVKGIEKVIKVAKMLENRRINYKLIITNKVNDKLIKKVKSSRIGKRIEFTGRIDRTKLLDIFSQAWILLFPSIYEEPLPYSIMEALLTGTVPLAAKTGGIPELVDNIIENVLFDPNNIVEFYNKLLDLIEILSSQGPEIFDTIRLRIGKTINTNDIFRRFIRILIEN